MFEFVLYFWFKFCLQFIFVNFGVIVVVNFLFLADEVSMSIFNLIVFNNLFGVVVFVVARICLVVVVVVSYSTLLFDDDEDDDEDSSEAFSSSSSHDDEATFMR